MYNTINDHHQWVLYKKNGTLIIGLTEDALKSTGEVYGIVPAHHDERRLNEAFTHQTGIHINACDRLCTIRSENGDWNIISPITGTICGFNWPLVLAYPSPINQNPYAAWIIKLKPISS